MAGGTKEVGAQDVQWTSDLRGPERSVDHDPFRHGRFIIIVNRGFIAFIKQGNGTLYKLHPLLDVQYKIQ